MKRAKDKYMINRTKYKDIKRYDHKQMEDFLTDVYKNGYADGKESVPGVELQDVEKALQDVKAGRVEQNQGTSGRAFQKGAVMKALTIIQPWATLIASGHKMNETRSWKTNYRGEVLIHAGKNPKDYTSGCYIDDPDGRHFQEAGITPNNFEDLPRGSIIGKATLVNCIHINKEFRDHLKRSNPAEYAFGDYRIGRYAWVFENPVLFEKPIPARGRQGLWNWEDDANE